MDGENPSSHPIGLFTHQTSTSLVCVSGIGWTSRGRSHPDLPFLGELWGEVGGDDNCEDAFDMVSSACFRWRSKLPSSDKDKIFFKACGELMPTEKKEIIQVPILETERDWGHGSVAGQLAQHAQALASPPASNKQRRRRRVKNTEYLILNIKSFLCISIQFCRFQPIYDLNVLCALLAYEARQGALWLSFWLSICQKYLKQTAFDVV